jgi:uncharacterized protein YecT (DUF1311 family)
MMKIVRFGLLSIYIFGLSTANFAWAQSTQTDLSVGAGSDYKMADAKLNQIYKRILTKYKDEPVFLQKLQKAQKAWIVFRDAQMAARFPNSPDEYGSAFSMCYSIEMTTLTNERIKQLKKWDEGIKEGDVCCGSYHIKD